jgi:trimeric autotransporter adhesin
MAYGTVKVDNITFDDGGSDQNVTVSGLYNSLTSGITVTGTISGAVVIGSTSVSGTTVAGVTVTGTTVQGASGTFTSLTGTTIQGTTATYTTGSFTSLTGTTIQGTTATYTTGSFTSLTGTTTTGTTANFASGVFTTSVSGTTVIASTGTFTSLTGTTTQGTTATYTTGSFTSLTGTTTTGTTSSFTSGVFTTLSGATATFTSGIIASGTAAAPSLAILGDPDTGVFSPGANQLAVATNGTERLRIDATGTALLKGTERLAFNTYVSDANHAGYIGRNTSTGALVIEAQNAGGGYPITFRTNSLERLRITDAGLVGVGTSSPAHLLHLLGGTATSFGLALEPAGWAGLKHRFTVPTSGDASVVSCNYNGSVVDNPTQSTSSITVGNGVLQLATGSTNAAPTTRLYVNAAGNVGIGTSSPEDKVHIEGAGQQTIRIRNTTEGSNASPQSSFIAFRGYYNVALAQIEVQDRSASNFGGWINVSTSNSSNVLTNAIHIDSSQRVGIGTTSPLHSLDISGASARLNNGTNASTNLYFGPVSAAGNYSYINWDNTVGSELLTLYTDGGGMRFSTAGSERARIDSSGRLGIGTTSPLSVLDVQTNAVERRSIRFSGTGLSNAEIHCTESGGYNRDLTFGASTLAFYIGSAGSTSRAEAARFDGSGRLLVGTSTSTSIGTRESLLQLSSTELASSLISVLNVRADQYGPAIALAKSRGGGSPAVQVNDLLGTIIFSGHDSTDLNTAGAYIQASVDGAVSTDDLPTRLVFSTTADGAASPTERLRITSAGNVGIGNTAPETLLHLLSSTDTYQTIQSTSASNNALTFYKNAGIASLGFYTGLNANEEALLWQSENKPLILSTNNLERLRIDSSGNVGIGITSPSGNLHVNGGSATIIADSDVYSTYEFYTSGVRKAFSQWENSANLINITALPASSQIVFKTGDTERGRWDGAGRLLVGTSSGRSVQGDHTPQIQLEGTGYASSTISVIANSNDTAGSYIFLGKSRGTTVGSNTIVQNNDSLGQIRFLGSDGSGDFSHAANIEALWIIPLDRVTCRAG